MPEPTYSWYMQEQIARAENWFPMIAGASPEIVSVDELWETTRGTPWYVPRAAFRIAAEAQKEHEGALELVNRLTTTDLIPRRWHKEGFQHLKEKYLYVVTYEGFNLDTGEREKQSIGYYSDEAQTVDEINQATDTVRERQYPQLALVGLTSTFTAAYHRQGATY